LATLRDRYVDGLTAYRHASLPGSPEAAASVNAWLDVFVQAAAIAVDRSESLVTEIKELRAEWVARLASHRTAAGLRPTPRADSAAARLLQQLPEAPIVTARTLDVSFPAASSALDELHRAGILDTKQVERGATAYIAREVLDLITLTERALASTKFDTRVSVPNRPVPDRPRY
jgi:hypothetical protein